LAREFNADPGRPEPTRRRPSQRPVSFVLIYDENGTMTIKTEETRGECPDFAAIYKGYFPRVYSFGYRLLGNSEQARDLAQEVFHRLYRQWRDGQAVQDVQGYLYRVAANLCTDWLRKERRFRNGVLRSFIPTEDPADGTVEDMIKEERIAMARRSLDSLPLRDRILLGLYQDGLSYQEIARSAGIRPSSVGTLLARAIKRIAKQVQQGEKG
jgi:RNA polymerase sigma factor (sigma-70 family)